MAGEINRDKILMRIDASLTNHYLSLEVTVVSVALAMAGVAMAGLITEPRSLGANLALIWLLWFGSLLGVAVAYAGPMIGAFALAPSIPTVMDLLPPIALGVAEFLMFAVLIRQVSPLAKLDLVINAWLWVMAAFGTIAFITIVRARYLLMKALLRNAYDGDIHAIIVDYVAYLGNNAWGPLPLIAVAASGAVLWSLHFQSQWFAFVLVILITILLIAGLIFHGRTARMWRSRLELEPEERPSIWQLLLRRQIRIRGMSIPDIAEGDMNES
jgi:hypothetical protein